MWFRKKKPLETVFFDIGGVVVDAPMEQYRVLGADIFGCREDHLVLCSAELLPLLETGKITSAEFWQQIGEKLAFQGMGRTVPGWRFKGFWEGILNETLVIHQPVLEICGRLKGRVTVAALSNTIQEHALVLQKEGVYKRFNPVILSCQVGMRKPNLDIYAKAAELAQTSPSKCLLVDDLEENIEGAKRAGFKTHHYRDLDGLRRDLSRLELL